jgi:dTDP-4-dehydrorhamnose reductase
VAEYLAALEAEAPAPEARVAFLEQVARGLVGQPIGAGVVHRVLRDLQPCLSSLHGPVAWFTSPASARRADMASPAPSSRVSRRAALRTTRVVSIATEDYATNARRPRNSRLDQCRLSFEYRLPGWAEALATEFNALASESGSVRQCQ